MAEIFSTGNGHGGHDWMGWAKYGGAGVAVATFIVGVVNGLWGIDAKIERIVVHLEQRDKAHDALEAVVKKIADRAITPDALDDKIKMAIQDLVLTNPGKLTSPYAPRHPKPTAVRIVPVKPAN
jgi:hypothetical protein